MLNEDEMAAPGVYKLQIDGSDFSVEKEFNLAEPQRRRR
jgi:hypothetical protein